MSQESNWPLKVWAFAIWAGLMFGAARMGDPLLDWLERYRGSVVTSQPGQGVEIPPDSIAWRWLQSAGGAS